MSAQLDNLLTHLKESDVMLREFEPEDLHWIDEASDQEIDQLLEAICSPPALRSS